MQKVVLLVQLIDIIGDKIINKNFPENNIMGTQKLQFKNDIIALCNEKKYDYNLVKDCFEKRLSLHQKIGIIYKNFAKSFELPSYKKKKNIIYVFCQIRNKASHGEFHIAQELFEKHYEEIKDFNKILIYGIYILVIRNDGVELSEYKKMFNHLYSPKQNFEINPKVIEYCKKVL